MFRAVRLVVDTGMHAKRWTREQAIDYMLANTGMGEGDVGARALPGDPRPGAGLQDRHDQNPRANARAPHDAFDIKEFHNVVLTNGAVPLDVLERIIDDWIASKA